MSDDKSPDGMIDREIRFAVVMYGGVSLAIYINGVAQELLKMVRATSDENRGKELKSTEKIYQKMADLLSNKKLLDEVCLMEDFAEIQAKLDAELETASFSSTRFVVDIISGTSAGGINGIFLAKALANNQSIDELKNLWLNEGDIGKLINDKKSVRDINLGASTKPKSLLNSRRMYLKLLDAVEGMEKDSKPKKSLVKEIDLFITVTDFKGVSVPLRLLDRVVYERRYRHVFHFRHSAENRKFDFEAKHNPMLAFAARCTSAFPFAFEPMRLSDAIEIIDEACSDAPTKIKNLISDKSKFFTKVTDRSGTEVEWLDRDLVDGGYLDNKPFSYAIDALSQRRADYQVERKLIYVEPSPENLNKNELRKSDAPDALENAKAAISDLPRYETIREDLQRVLERNRLIERVNRLTSSAERDVFTYLTTTEAKNWKSKTAETLELTSEKRPKNGADQIKTGAYWETLGLENIVKIKGHAVIPYYRLRISSLTDDIARLVTRKVGVEEESEYFLAIRSLVNLWRKANYVTYFDAKSAKKDRETTVLSFLRSYDLNYRLRRLRFVQQKANQLFRFDEDCQTNLEIRQRQLSEIREMDTAFERKTVNTKNLKKTENAENLNQPVIGAPEQTFVEETIEVDVKSFDKSFSKSRKSVARLMPSEIIWKFCTNEDKTPRPERLEDLRTTVNYFQTVLNPIFEELQKEKENLISRERETDELSKAIQSVKLTEKQLEILLKITEDDQHELITNEKARRLFDVTYQDIAKPIKIAAEELKNLFDRIFESSRDKINISLRSKSKELPSELENKGIDPVLFQAVRGYLLHFYQSFDDYDQISFPVFYETEVGEAVKVDILRISPVDAKFLINEEDVNENRRKLAGTSLFNFGAFIDRVWRKNDIMWGRLDGAERLITAVLPDEKYESLRKYFAEQMNRTILEEELMESDKVELRQLLANSFINAGAGIELKDVVRKIAGDVLDDAVKTRLSAVLRTCFENHEIVNFVRENYEVDRKSEPKEMLRAISRATQVTGNVLEGIADKHGQSGDSLRWISRLGQIFWGLVEVAAPSSIWNKVFQHWLKLFYAFEVILIGATTIFGKADLQQFGIISLVLTLIIHITVLTLKDFMNGGNLMTLIRFLAVGLFIVLCLSGAVSIFAFFFQNDLWTELVNFQTYVASFHRWQKLLPISAIVTLFAAAFAWREVEKPSIRFVGWVVCGYVIVCILLSFLFSWSTQDSQTQFAIWQANNLADPSKALGVLLNLEFAESVKDVFKVAGDLGNPARNGLKNALLVDSFVFVPIYTAFLIFFSRLLRYRRNHWRFSELKPFSSLKSFYLKQAKIINEKAEHLDRKTKLRPIGVVEKIKNWLILVPLKKSLDGIGGFTVIGIIAKLTVFIIICAGISDLIENFFTYRILGESIKEIQQWSIDTVRFSATLKFGLLATTTLIFSLIFSGRKAWWKLIAALLILMSILGFVGLVWHPAILIFMLAQMVILAVISFVFIAAPNKFGRA